MYEIRLNVSLVPLAQVIDNHYAPDDGVNRIREILFAGHQPIDELKPAEGQVHGRGKDEAANYASDSPPQGEASKGDNHGCDASNDGP